MQYFFILGRNPELSLAEINTILPQPCSIQDHGNGLVIVDCPEINHKKIMKRLGGTTKMGVIQGTINKEQLTSDELLKYLDTLPNEKKIFVGFSAYGLNEKIRLPDSRQLRQLGIEIKHTLQEQGYKVRIVTSKQPTLSSVTVQKEKLLRRGAEIVLIFTRSAALYVPLGRGIKPRATSHGDILIGKTLAVQEFEQAGQRDYGRPARSIGVGMLPVQLAKIMINLANPSHNATILDPFCGLGTVLSEAFAMGYQNLIGSDIEQKMINATQENLSWLGEELGIRNYESGIKLFCSPVEKLSEHLTPDSVDAIVTEPYLGHTRGIRNYESGIMDELRSLYINAFHEFAKILKPGGRVVFIFPIFVTKRRRSSLSDEILPEIKKLGFQPIPLLPRNPITQLLNYPITSLVYSRPDQKVLREIFVFELKP